MSQEDCEMILAFVNERQVFSKDEFDLVFSNNPEVYIALPKLLQSNKLRRTKKKNKKLYYHHPDFDIKRYKPNRNKSEELFVENSEIIETEIKDVEILTVEEISKDFQIPIKKPDPIFGPKTISNCIRYIRKEISRIGTRFKESEVSHIIRYFGKLIFIQSMLDLGFKRKSLSEVKN